MGLGGISPVQALLLAVIAGAIAWGVVAMIKRRNRPKAGRTTSDTTFTALPPDQACAVLVQSLTGAGATVTSQTDRSIAGVMHIRRTPSCIVACLLFLLLIIPGVVYLIIAGKNIDDPFSLALVPEGQGTMVHPSGTGYGLEVAMAVTDSLPR